jgi:hypothetical protein
MNPIPMMKSFYDLACISTARAFYGLEHSRIVDAVFMAFGEAVR